MDKRNIIYLAVGLVFGIVALIFINQFIGEQRTELARLKAAGEIVDVVIAKRDISKETIITNEMIQLEQIKRSQLQPGDLDSLDSAIGKFADVDILRGQHVNSEMLRALSNLRYLSEGVPQGMRAMTIAVDKISAVEGLVKPGDRVDIIGTFNFPTAGGQGAPIVVTLFQGVKVLAVNRNISAYRVSERADTLTLAMKPEDIKMLTYSLEIGRIRMTLRAPLDTSEDKGYQAVTFEALLDKIGMRRTNPVVEEQPKVDVFLGSNIKEVPVEGK